MKASNGKPFHQHINFFSGCFRVLLQIWILLFKAHSEVCIRHSTGGFKKAWNLCFLLLVLSTYREGLRADLPESNMNWQNDPSSARVVSTEHYSREKRGCMWYQLISDVCSLRTAAFFWYCSNAALLKNIPHHHDHDIMGSWAQINQKAKKKQIDCMISLSPAMWFKKTKTF